MFRGVAWGRSRSHSTNPSTSVVCLSPVYLFIVVVVVLRFFCDYIALPRALRNGNVGVIE